MSNVDSERERIKRLKNYVNQISISTPPLKYDLINKIEKGKITNTHEIKNYIDEFEKPIRNKVEYRKIVNDYNLDDTSKMKLELKINDDEITTKEELKKEITKEKKKTDLRRLKRESIAIVHSSNISYFSKTKLLSKIENNEITSKEELIKEITGERKKPDLRKIVKQNTHIDNTSKSELNSKINQNEIITENQLKEELENEKTKTELRKELKKIVIDTPLSSISKSKLIIKINQEKIRTKNKLTREINAEKIKKEHIISYDDSNDYGNHESYGGNYHKNLYG